MSDVYNEWTVATLKDELRERNLPVSGNKSVLVQRLIDNDKEHPKEEKIEFECSSCDSTLRISAKHTRKVKCPKCGEIQQINASIKIPNLPKLPDLGKINLFGNLSKQNQTATIISGIGIILLISSGFLFLNALSINSENQHTFDVPYDEIETTKWNCEDGTQVMLLDVNDGVEDCPDGSDEWAEKMIGQIFYSCCILLPLSLIMGLIGVFSSQSKGSTNFDAIMPTKDAITPSTATFTPSDSPQTEEIDSTLAKTIRIAGISLSASVVTILIIGILIAILLFIYAIWVAISEFQGSTGFPW
ncbi:MAG: hypothetical protein CMB72_03925 [Euryarchaeota archaeon]|nr:hypothetical protein [Euryarchaeota archaeon]